MPHEARARFLIAPKGMQPAWPHLTRLGRGARRVLGKRYSGLPPWLLLVQVFLAAGWLRAAIAHGKDPAWWSGDDISLFRDEHREIAIEWYRVTMLDGPVANWPIAIGAVVLVSEVIVAALLVLNIRPLLALGIGAGLNVNFVLGGAVDPSAFYLVLGAAIALWHVEANVGPRNNRRLVSASTFLGALACGALIPQITTLDPALVIDDPAMVLSFIVVLWAVVLRAQRARIHPILRPGDTGPGDGHAGVRARPHTGGVGPRGGSRTRCRSAF